MDTIKDVIIVGGGAAGFFSAINIASINPELKILMLERGKEGLQKVKVSGGGRCNVTHAEFIPSELVLNYPRGEKELLGPFHQFMTGDTIQWFEDRGIVLKTENDGRMFPESNKSQTIIDCFLSEVKKLNINKISIFTPYTKEINDSIINYFKKENITINSLSYFDIASDIDIGKVDEKHLFNVLSKIELKNSEALFVSCTALPVLSIIDKLEKKLKKIVLSSNQTLIWDSLNQINFKEKIAGFGKLFNS